MDTQNRNVLIFYLVIGVLIIAALIYYRPWSTPIDLNLNAVKLDTDGNEICIVQITIQGKKLDYLFKPSRLDISITPFENLKGIHPVEYANTGVYGQIQTSDYDDVRFVYYGAWDNTSNETESVTLGFSPDLDRWILTSNFRKVCYVASVSGDCSTQELTEYFRLLLPSK